MNGTSLDIYPARMVFVNLDAALDCFIVDELFGGLKGAVLGARRERHATSERNRWQAGKQVVDLLVVELHELNEDGEFGTRITVFGHVFEPGALDPLEQIRDGARDYALLTGKYTRRGRVERCSHRVRFPRACLTVGKNGGVVAVETRVD